MARNKIQRQKRRSLRRRYFGGLVERRQSVVARRTPLVTYGLDPPRKPSGTSMPIGEHKRAYEIDHNIRQVLSKARGYMRRNRFTHEYYKEQLSEGIRKLESLDFNDSLQVIYVTIREGMNDIYDAILYDNEEENFQLSEEIANLRSDTFKYLEDLLTNPI